MRHARHAAVHAVQNHGNENGHSGQLEMLVHRLHDGVKAGKQRGQGKRVGQQVNALAAQRGFVGYRIVVHGLDLHSWLLAAF